MSIEIIQNILIVLLAGYVTLDNLGITIVNYWAVTTGMIAGFIMGDLKTGLLIGGTFQLMSLGVAGWCFSARLWVSSFSRNILSS